MMASMRSDELRAVRRETAYVIAELRKLLMSCAFAEFPSLERGGFLKPQPRSGGSPSVAVPTVGQLPIRQRHG